jgi:hypothetical protein
MLKIHDHYAPTDFIVLDMGEEEDDTPIILGRPFLNTTNMIIYVGSGQVHFQFPRERYDVIIIVILLMSSQRRTAPGGGVDHPVVKRTNPDGMNGKMNNLKSL